MVDIKYKILKYYWSSDVYTTTITVPADDIKFLYLLSDSYYGSVSAVYDVSSSSLTLAWMS